MISGDKRYWARRLARQLINDDLGRVDEVALERDGALAVTSWYLAAANAGDSDTTEAIDAVGRDELIAAWDELIDELVPLEEED